MSKEVFKSEYIFRITVKDGKEWIAMRRPPVQNKETLLDYMKVRDYLHEVINDLFDKIQEDAKR